MQQWKERLLSKEEWFQGMLKYSIAVDRQITSTKSDEIVNCMVGTYKKLNIDWNPNLGTNSTKNGRIYNLLMIDLTHSFTFLVVLGDALTVFQFRTKEELFISVALMIFSLSFMSLFVHVYSSTYFQNFSVIDIWKTCIPIIL